MIDDVPRIIEVMFEAHARARAIGREFGLRSAQYYDALAEVDELRVAHEEETLCRAAPAQPRRAARSNKTPTAKWATAPRTVTWRRSG